MGAFIPITLGGKVYKLAELPRGANREYQVRFKAAVYGAMEATGPLDTMDEAIDAIAASADLMLDLLLAYDVAGAAGWERPAVLPDREWIDSHATDRECYESMKVVLQAVFPPVGDLLSLLPELRPLLLQAISKGVAAATIAMTSVPSTSSVLPSTDGSPTTSSAV